MRGGMFGLQSLYDLFGSKSSTTPAAPAPAANNNADAAASNNTGAPANPPAPGSGQYGGRRSRRYKARK